MAVSFALNYGSLIVPIAADLAFNELISRVGFVSKAKMACWIAGIAVSLFFAWQASPLIALSGAFLYLVYKVYSIGHYRANLPDLQATEKNLHKDLTVTSDKALNAVGSNFDEQLNAAFQESIKGVDPRDKWKDRIAWRNVTAMILLVNCQVFLFRIYKQLEEKTKHLEANSAARIVKMAELLDTPPFDKDGFIKALAIFHRTYRLARYRGCLISLPKTYNGPTTYPILEPLNREDYQLFFTGGESHCNALMNRTFNQTIDRLGGLLEACHLNNPPIVKDELCADGDSDPSNPFRIEDARRLYSSKEAP